MNAVTTPWFSDAEIEAMCEPLTQPAAQVKYLRSQGLHVTVKPNGRPLVMRDHAERVLSGLEASVLGMNGKPMHAVAKPDRSALVLAFRKQPA